MEAHFISGVIGSMNDYDVIVGCGDVLSYPAATFKTPLHPNNYVGDLFCVWLIEVEAGSIITLSFSAFLLEDNFGCTFDYVKIYDGPGQNVADLIGQ